LGVENPSAIKKLLYSNKDTGGLAMEQDSENRRSYRHTGKLPLEFDSGKGVTKDYSGSGVFFETDKSFSPGQKIEFSIYLQDISADLPRYMRCSGEIVRVESKGEKIGVAATIKEYSFTDLPHYLS
jgi:hypothetical protein